MFSITPSLYATYLNYVFSENNDDSQLLAVLNREQLPQTPAMKKGIDFENEVYQYFKNGLWSNSIDVNHTINLIKQEIYPNLTDHEFECKNQLIGAIQYKVSKVLTENIEVHGVIDIITPMKIFDLKRVQSYSLGKYEQSIQHLIYMYATDIQNFEYLISDGSSVYSEYYKFDKISLGQLKHRINTMIDFLLSFEKYRTPFLQKWTLK